MHYRKSTMRHPFHSLVAVFAIAVLSMSLVENVSAHAVVTASSLANEPVKARHPTRIALFFNSNVELSLSRVFWVSAGDVFHPADIAHGKKPGELLIQIPALDPGEYAIKYKVFAADGHLTEASIRFHVAP